ncbi:MAG: PKD domain-containing protein [bacterium]|nr:PKD domain-containing protein [bacterium]
MLLRNFTIALAIVAVGVVGFQAAPTSALTVDEVQAQIQKLMTTISDLTAQLNRLRAQVVTPQPVSPTPSPYMHRICNVLARNLAAGAQGDDVRGLQEFLYENKFLTVQPTGYFGMMTQEAVKRWQAQEGVSAIGAFGPMSRERMKIWCGGGNENFRATPQRGPAPLTVTFYAKVNGFLPADSYVIEFGDGSSEPVANCYAAADACNRGSGINTNTHVYNSDGTYTATLIHTSNPCGGNPACMAPVSREVVGKVQINVGPIACTKEYKPVCGSKPIVCVTTPCNPIPTTYGNRCEMNADGASFLYEGQCKTSYSDPKNDPMCKAWDDGIACGGTSCGRNVPGGTPWCSEGQCYPTTPQPAASWRCTAYFDNTSNKPPVISGFSGPTTLAEDTTGTWTVKASDPEGGSLSYQVWWGDENVYAANMTTASAAREFIQSTTFTHAYSNPGTYTVSITVRDNVGQEAKTSTNVQVSGGGTLCTAQYEPVCGQPPEPACRYSIPACMMATPGPQTYSNRCMLNAAGATYLYNGQCNNGY